MDTRRRTALSVALSICLIASGCASNLSQNDLHELGNYEIVYLQPAANFTADQYSGGLGYAAMYLLAGPLAVAGSVAGVAQKNGYQQEALAIHAEQIKSLGFDDRVHAMFMSAVEDVPWFTNKEVKTLRGFSDPGDYTRTTGVTSVIYLRPKFALTSFGRIFEVDVIVGVQRFYRDGVHDHVEDVYRKEFIFKHDLVLKKPGMTWEQQKDAAHALASMDPDDATQYWLEDNASRLRADFEQDLPQVEHGVREFLGDPPNKPGN